MRGFLLLPVVIASCTPNSDTPVCDFKGDYRLRYEASKGQWRSLQLRLDTYGKSATTATLDDQPRPVTLDPDRPSCKVSATVDDAGTQIHASLTLDPKANSVSGTVRRGTERKTTALQGVRDTGKTKPPACVRLGVYELVVANDQPWTPDRPDVRCDAASLRMPFVVEYANGKLVIEQLKNAPTVFTADTIEMKGDCTAHVGFDRAGRKARATLMFDTQGIAAEGEYAEMWQSTYDGEWNCIVTEPILSIERAGSSKLAAAD